MDETDNIALPKLLVDEPLTRHTPAAEPKVMPKLISKPPAMRDQPFEPIGEGKEGYDVPREFAKKAFTGLVESTAGLGGDVPTVTQNIMPWIASKIGFGDYQKKMEDEAKRIAASLTPSQRQATAARKPMLPTSEDVAETLSRMTVADYPVGKKLYEPAETQLGEQAGRVGRFAGAMASPAGGPVRGMLRRGVEGTIGGIAGETYEAAREGSPEVPYVKPALEMLGAGATSGARSFLTGAQTRGERELANILSAAYEQGKIKITPEQIMEANRKGIPLSFADVSDPATRNAAMKFAGYGPQAGETVGEYNLNLPRAQIAAGEAPSYLGQIESYLETLAAPKASVQGRREPTFGPSAPQPSAPSVSSISGRVEPSLTTVGAETNISPLNPVKIAEQAKAERAASIDAMYEAARQNPNSKLIFFHNFDPRLQESVSFRDAMVDAANEATNINVNKNIADSKYVSVPGLAADGTMTAGNLPYWDLVKRSLDKQISQAKSASDAANLLNVKSALTDHLDNLVPEYGQSRNKAFESFGAQSSPEVGQNIYNAKGVTNRTQRMNAYDSLPENQQNLARQGWLGELNSDIQNGNLSKVTSKMVTNPEFIADAQKILGPDDFQNLKSQLVFHDIKNKSKELAFQAQNMPSKFDQLKSMGLKTGIGYTAATVAADLIQNALNNSMSMFFLKPELAIPTAMGATAVYGGKLISQNRLKYTADELAKAFTSTDPKAISRIQKLMQSPEGNLLVNKLYSTYRGATYAQSGLEAAERQGERAYGGRINRATGGRVGNAILKADALIRKADQAKRNLSKETEPMLELPDEHVTKALAVAKAHI